jgi:enoyl-CoA hydratase
VAVTHLAVQDDAGVRTVTIDRPDAKNALSRHMRSELCELLLIAEADSGVKAVILTGTDPVFTAGVDFKDVDPAYDPVEAQFALNPGWVLRAMRTPVICAVNGACVSGGLEIVLSATFAVASQRARFADTHGRLNAVPTWGLTALLPRTVGLRKAREMSITGNFVDAAEALRIGLVNHVVRHDELLGFTRQLVADIADAPAASEILSLYDCGADLALNAALALETAYTAARKGFDRTAFEEAGRAVSRREQRP